MKRRNFLSASLALTALLIGGCSAKPVLPDYRYRLTVEVETPEGLRTGSSVIQVASHVSSPQSLNPGDVSTQVRGEAAAVDLPEGKVLFALLTKPDRAEGASEYAFDALIPTPWAGWEEYVRDVNALVKRRDVGVLPAKAYPMLVTFGDIADPKTIERVEPANLAEIFGTGVKLRRITIQMTDEPVSTGIENRLTWLPRVYEILQDSSFHPDGILVGNFQNIFSSEKFR